MLPEMMSDLVRGELSPADFDAKLTPAEFDTLLSDAEARVLMQEGRTVSPRPPPLPPLAPPPAKPPPPPTSPIPRAEAESGVSEVPVEHWLPGTILGLLALIALIFLGVVYHLSGGAVITYLRLMGSHSNPAVVAGYLPKHQRDKMRAEVRLRKRAHDDPLVFFQAEQERLEQERLAARQRESEAKEGSVVGSSCGSVTSSQYAVAKKEKKKDIYDLQMQMKQSKEVKEEVEQDPVLPLLGGDDVAAVQRLLHSAYNAQRAFILAAEAQQQGALAADDEEARAAATEDRRAAEAAAERLKEVFAAMTQDQAQHAFVAAAEAAARALEAAEDEEDEEALKLEEIKVKMEAKGLLVPQRESYSEIQATYGYGNPDSPDADDEQGGEDDATGHGGEGEEGARRRRRRRGKESLAEADMEGVDVEDAATVNLLLARVGAGLTDIRGVPIIPASEQGELAATTPYQVQRCFVASAEAALKAVEETEKTKKQSEAGREAAMRKKVLSDFSAKHPSARPLDGRVADLLGASGDYGQDGDSDDGAGAAATMTAEERARAKLDVIMREMNMPDTAPMPSVLTAQRSAELALSAAAGGARSPESPGTDGDETEQEQARRVAWIKHYIKLGDYDRAIELGWDGAPPSAAS
jgi:hypothetical protein